MKSWVKTGVLVGAVFVCLDVGAQEPKTVKGADPRYKADILIVVAHPDDEAFFTPYAEKAIYDMHKHVAVIFTTYGGSGMNWFSRERGPALANIREIEAREACAKLGIQNVWFLGGKDTPSQDVLDSLSNWGHGASLEKLVGLIRLTRPEVIFTQFPGIFIGENHGDHQATGVLVTEAFDLAGDPTIFPSQVSGPMKDREVYLSNMEPWQAKKLYFASDANNQKQFDGSGPTYSPREVSPSQKKPYAVLAMRAAMGHLTQAGPEFERLSKMNDEELEKLVSDPKTEWWSDPETLIFGKSAVDGKPTDEVFADITTKVQKEYTEGQISCGKRVDEEDTGAAPWIELGGPWQFYKAFYPKHGLCQLPLAKMPEIGIKSGTNLVVPLVIHHDPTKSLKVSLTVKAPEGWKAASGTGQFVLPGEETTALQVQVETPKLSSEDLKKLAPQDVRVNVEAEGKTIGSVTVRVELKGNALPE
jgi:LmbE family N-acetylglucosaminyl deacetylase